MSVASRQPQRLSARRRTAARKSSRTAPGASALSSARTAFRAFHAGASARTERRVPFLLPEALPAMGTLYNLEVDHGDGDVQTYEFDNPLPRLCYTHLAQHTGRGSRRSQLYVVGGQYRFSPRGLHALRGRSPLKPLSAAAAGRRFGRVRASYEATHGGHTPARAYRGAVEVPEALVAVGKLVAIGYGADKAERKPRDFAPYRHEFSPPARPSVCVPVKGAPVVLAGGNYTVTPHGIEDRETAQ